MALIKCSECQKEVSDKAVSCPNCGNPIFLEENQVVNKVEIEMTNKKWKKRSLFAIALLFFGFILMSKSTGLGLLVIFIAFCVMLTARIGAWWTNG
jgi:DNA-directed RNA polymerase subunit RPC12/RpoP